MFLFLFSESNGENNFIHFIKNVFEKNDFFLAILLLIMFCGLIYLAGKAIKGEEFFESKNDTLNN